MKNLIGVIVGLFSYLKFAPVALAATPGPDTPVSACPRGDFFKLCELTSGDFSRVVQLAVNLLFVVAIIIAVVFLIYGGIKWVLSGGDKTAVETARNHIVAAIVGLIIVFVAYFIINVVIGFFIPGFSLQNLKLPSL